jgi:hypothetical protein
MPRTPPAGPHFQIDINGKTYGGNLTQAVWDAILEGQRDAETNIGSLVSGYNEVRAAASVAQVTADAAQQQAADVGQEALPFSASVSPGYATGAAKVNITTNSVTVTPNGGVAPYSYAWTYVSGDAFTVLSPTSATTAFRSTSASEGVYKCTVTDSTPGTPLTASVNVGISTSTTVD